MDRRVGKVIALCLTNTDAIKARCLHANVAAQFTFKDLRHDNNKWKSDRTKEKCYGEMEYGERGKKELNGVMNYVEFTRNDN